MKNIRWGIAGAGGIANKFAKAVENVEGATLAAVASRSEERGCAFAEKYDIENVFTSYEEMAASNEVDAVYVATAHPFHKSCAEIFLNAKKPVLCEKPLCVNADEAKELASCAKKNGVFLMEAMWTKFLPATKLAVKAVSEGKIGEAMELSADFCYCTEKADEPNLFNRNMAGGSLLDVGVYGLHFASLFFGEKTTEIKSAAKIEDGVDTVMEVLLKYESGAIAKISSATRLSKPADGIIYGTKGRIYMPCFYGASELTIAGDKISAPMMGEGFEEEIAECCNCIREGKTESDIHPLASSIRILEQMDEIRKQCKIHYPADTKE